MRFEKQIGDSRRFWEVLLKGRRVSTRTGKVGLSTRNLALDGRATDREYADVELAQRSLERMIASKLEDGFRRVDGVDPDALPKFR